MAAHTPDILRVEDFEGPTHKRLSRGGILRNDETEPALPDVLCDPEGS